ncbi:MAG: hypothetical protein QOH47_794 [Sphingomonadales bacterium]|jgi:hypothetical protein|nr:hypothetical protein [Sphingomonadales bacterium]
MRRLIILAALAATACATTGARVREVQTQDVVVTHVEQAITAQQVRDTAPPPPMGPRPATISGALDAALAKLCEYVGYADRADVLIHHGAGLAPASRVFEPVCQGHSASPR